MTYAIHYDHEDLRKLCERKEPNAVTRAALARFGKAGAKKLARRVKELEISADTVELRQGPGDWHPITHDWPGCLGGDLDGGSSIIVQSITTPTGEPGWRVLCIGDCYKH